MLLFGQTGSLCASILFGFAQNYPWAVLARSMSGLLNGTVGVSKTYLGEICDSTNVAKAFAWIGFAWGFGTIAGSVFGGFTARPAQKYPSVFSPDGIFAKQPYLIPNLVAASITFIGLVLCYFFLTENPKKAHAPPASEEELNREFVIETKQNDEKDPNEEELTSLDSSDTSSGSDSPQDKQQELDANGGELEPIPSALDVENGKSSPALSNSFAGRRGMKDSSLPWHRRGIIAKIVQVPAYIKGLPIFAEWPPVLCCLIYAIFGCFQTMADEIWPLWAQTPVSEGGLGFTTNKIGVVNSWAGVCQLSFNLVLYPIMAKRFGVVKSFWIGCIGSSIIYPLYPLINMVRQPIPGENAQYVIFYGTLGLLVLFRICVTQAGFSSVMTMISNSVFPETMGSANGLGQSMVAFTRMLGPFIAASILAVSVSPSMIWPLNHGRLAFYTVGAIGVVNLFISLRLPKSVNVPRIEAEDAKRAAHDAGHLDIIVEDVNGQTSSSENDLHIRSPSDTPRRVPLMADAH